MLAVPAATLERYRGVLLARRATGLGSVAEVAARAGEFRYSEVLPGSTSGALVQAGELRRAGGAPSRFAVTRYTGTHEAALEDLLASRADVAALAERSWRELLEERERASSLVEVWRSPPLPPGPIVCVEHSKFRCVDVADALLDSDEPNRDAASALAAGWAETTGAEAFARVPDRSYADFSDP